MSGAGALTGLGIGMLAAEIFRRAVPDLPVAPPLWAIISAVITALLTGVLFGVLPARRAARLDPVQALAKR